MPSLWLLGILASWLLAPTASAITTVRVATGLQQPLFITYAPGDAGRLYIVERGGRIKVLQNGQISGTFLDVRSLVETGYVEQGLLGLAFDPQFSANGTFYIYYTRGGDGWIVISRYHATNSDNADPASAQILLTIPHPYQNHNGGMITFGPDGFFYFGTGDGGSGGDPGNRAQSDTTLLGKLLRIDVHQGSPYAIPPDNPFANSQEGRPEIWAKGLRNPWRFSFDRQTHDLYIGDVGQDRWEEVDVQPANVRGLQNYGWRLMEGNHCYNPPQNCDPGGLVHPIHEYGHNVGCSITGGYVYRGSAIPDLAGTYFFADYCSARIWSFRYQNGQQSDFQERTAELAPGGGQTIQAISSFGEDAQGELYICDLNQGSVFKIVPRATSTGSARDDPPTGFRLYANNPNPFNPVTQVSFDLASTGPVDLGVYNIFGQRVATLAHGAEAAGHHAVTFDGSQLPSGIYLCRLRAVRFTAIQKMLLLK
ncbi:MAG TPA: PQQ-dependent sugar dehydrogenase [bacterium]|jgi:glucose/arabinose dehydrogenase